MVCCVTAALFILRNIPVEFNITFVLCSRAARYYLMLFTLSLLMLCAYVKCIASLYLAAFSWEGDGCCCFFFICRNLLWCYVLMI